MGRTTQIALFVFVAFVAYMAKGFIDFGIVRPIENHSVFDKCTDIVENQGKHISKQKWTGSIVN